MLSSTVVVDILGQLNQRYGLNGPLDNIGQLQTVINRAKTIADIEWTLIYVKDSLEMRFLEVGDFSVAKLNKGLVDLALLKQTLKKHLLHTYIDQYGFVAAGKEKLRKLLESHNSVRKQLTPFPGETPYELSWQIHYPDSIKLMADFIEELCYGSKFDSTLRTAVKHRRDVTDILAYDCIKEELGDVVKRVEKEATTFVPGSATTITVDGANDVSVTAGKNADPDELLPVMDDADTKAIEAQIEKVAVTDAVVSAVEHWTMLAKRLVRKYVRIIPYPETEKQLSKEMQSSDLGSMRGDMTGLSLLHYDQKLAGEAITDPRLRVCPYSEKGYQKYVRGVLEGRSDPNLPDNSEYKLNVGSPTVCGGTNHFAIPPRHHELESFKAKRSI